MFGNGWQFVWGPSHVSLFIKPSAKKEPPLMPSMPLTPEPPTALAHLVTPAQAAPPPPPPEPPPGSPLVLQPPPPKPVSKAREAAARAYREAMGGEGREATLAVPAEPYDLPPPLLEHELASLQAAVSEVTLEGEIGRLTLVHAYSSQPRQELTFRDAAHLRTLVQIFPGARVVAITKPDVSAEGASPSAVEELHDAAEPPEDPFDLGEALDFPGADGATAVPPSAVEPDPFDLDEPEEDPFS